MGCGWAAAAAVGCGLWAVGWAVGGLWVGCGVCTVLLLEGPPGSNWQRGRWLARWDSPAVWQHCHGTATPAQLSPWGPCSQQSLAAKLGSKAWQQSLAAKLGSYPAAALLLFPAPLPGLYRYDDRADRWVTAPVPEEVSTRRAFLTGGVAPSF